MKTATHSNIEIESLSHDGRGITHINGKTVFVNQAVPGDTVSIKIYNQHDKYDEANLAKIETPSTDRQEPFCSLYKECGGCQLQHINIEAQRFWKTENFIKRLTQSVNAKSCKVATPLTGDDTSYRRRARLGLAISKIDKVARLGFRRKDSNELVDIEQCPILTPELNKALKKQRPELLEQASRAYKELTMVEADNGIFATLSSDKTDASQKSYYKINDLILNFPADGFIQVNQQQNQQMISQALDWLELDSEHKVLDLFCGVGNFTLPIAQKCKKVVGIEGLMELINTAENNANNSQLGNTEFFKANLFDDCQKSPWFRQQKYQRILLDPGRQGAFELSKNLHKLKADIIVYVSCNAATLIRDIKELEKQGYQLKKTGLIDMFPNTVHTEVMVQLKKSKKPKKPKDRIFRI